jgi:hypothetical protein
MATYYYTSTDAPESIIAFYEEHGDCGQGDAENIRRLGRELCRGKSLPFGEYFVGIDVNSYEAQGTTSFWIEIRWQGCTGDLE